MEKTFNRNNEVTLQCSIQEASDIWYSIEMQLNSMKTEGLESSKVYIRLLRLRDVFCDKSATIESISR